MILPALALLTSLAADTVPPPATAPPTEEWEVPASVIVHSQPAIPIVALRLSLLADDPGGFAGAGHLIQHLHLPRLREMARRVGAQVQIQRNTDAVVYSVTGPAAELEYLAGILRSALLAPAPSPGEMVVAMRELEEERLAEWETASAHVRADLRSRLFPSDLSAAGTAGSARRLESAPLSMVWGEMYQPERVSVVAVGDVGIEDVRRVFAQLPSRPRERLRGSFADTVPLARLAPAEATRAWLGLGYAASEVDPAALTVTARLLGDVLRDRLPASLVQAEHWWTHHGQALALVVATPDAQLAAARRSLGTLLTSLQQELTERRVRDAVIAVRREMLFYARTPDRMAEVVGRFADRDGEADAAQHFFAELERIGLEDVQAVIEQLAERTPVRIDIPPQELQRRT